MDIFSYSFYCYFLNITQNNNKKKNIPIIAPTQQRRSDEHNLACIKNTHEYAIQNKKKNERNKIQKKNMKKQVKH